MLFQLPQKFFTAGDCGCSSSSSQSARPLCTTAGATICDDRYLSLQGTNELQLLGVPAGSNCQAFLKAADGVRGFVTYQNGKAKVDPAPQITLPLMNPPVSGSYPVPGGFKYIVAGTSDPADWKHVAAPTAGTWILQVKNGSFQLIDAGTIPGINQVGDGGTVAKGQVMAMIQLDDGSWAVRKLAVQHARVLVGDVDVDGVPGYKALPINAALVHPIGKFQNLRGCEFQMLDTAGAEIAGGMEQAVVTGGGSIADPTKMVYSPTNKRIYKAPPGTVNFSSVTTLSAGTNPPVSYANMPSGHGAGSNLVYNYDKVRVDFQMRTNAAEIFTLGLFKDGVLVQEFPYVAAQDAASFSYVDTATLGNHTYDVRWKRVGGGSGLVAINLSSLLITTLG